MVSQILFTVGMMAGILQPAVSVPEKPKVMESSTAYLTDVVRPVYKYNILSDDVPYMAEHYNLFVIPPGLGASKIEKLQQYTTSVCATMPEKCPDGKKQLLWYIKIGGLHDTDEHYADVVAQNLFWRMPSGAIAKHTTNDWDYVNIIDRTTDWSRVLIDFVTDKKIVGNDADAMQTIQQTFDGIFWDNTAADMVEFIYDPSCGKGEPGAILTSY